MAVHFEMWCEEHEIGGPIIRNGAGGVRLAAREGPFLYANITDAPVQRQWDAFLGEHEFCDLRLRREGQPWKDPYS